MKRRTLTIAAVAFCSAVAAIAAVDPNQPYQGKPADLDIYLMIGQSNMSGRSPIEAQDKLPIPRFYLADDKGNFVPATHPLNKYSTISKGLGMQKLNLGNAFARTLLALLPESKSIGLIVQARGGSKIESWEKGTKYYKEAIRRVQAVKGKGVLRGICWHQGESNFKDTDYLPKLEKLVADLRADLGDPNLPFVVGQIRREKDGSLSEINKQISELPEHVKHTDCVSSKGLTTMYNWHFKSESLRELGRRYARAMWYLVYFRAKPEQKKPPAARHAAVNTSPAERKLTWRKTSDSTALLNNGEVVWTFAYSRERGKPSMSIGLLDGTELTRPWPIPQGYAHADHPWHKGLWWSWKGIDHINFWEEHQAGTDPTTVTPTLNDDGSARFDMTISYHLPNNPPLAMEKRTVEVSAPDASGSYLVTWHATFTAGGEKSVTFDRNGYGGLAMRFAAAFSGDPAKDPNAWTFIKSDEAAAGQKRTSGNRWMAYAGTAQNGKLAYVAMFDCPSNPRYPTRWAVRPQYPYLNPCFITTGDYVLDPGKPLTLTYGVLVSPTKADKTQIEKAWKAFTAKKK